MDGLDGLPYGIVIDQLGSYLALSTFGLMVAARYSGQPLHWSEMARRIVTFPPLVALGVLRKFSAALADLISS